MDGVTGVIKSADGVRSVKLGMIQGNEVEVNHGKEVGWCVLCFICTHIYIYYICISYIKHIYTCFKVLGESTNTCTYIDYAVLLSGLALEKLWLRLAIFHLLLSHCFSLQSFLGGGFKYFLFSPLLGEMIQFDQYFSDGLVQPRTSFASSLNPPALEENNLDIRFKTSKFFLDKIIIHGTNGIFTCINGLFFKGFYISPYVLGGVESLTNGHFAEKCNFEGLDRPI